MSPTATAFWVRLRFHATGHEETYTETSALNRGLLIIITRDYADVVAQGERLASQPVTLSFEDR